MSDKLTNEPLEEKLKNIIRQKSEENSALRKLLENLENSYPGSKLDNTKPQKDK